MKYLLTVFFLSLFSIPINGQSIDSLNNEIYLLGLEKEVIDEKIDSLETLKFDLDQKITVIRKKINQVELQNQKEKGIPTKISSMGGKLRDTPSLVGNTIAELNENDEILIYDWFQKPYFKASFEGKAGYISYSSLVENEFIKNALGEIKAEQFKKLEEDNPKFARLIKKYGKATAARIMAKDIWIGMTSEMAQDALGKPGDINRSTFSWGVHEQWVYSNGKYLYFEDGVLTSWQD
jgi:DNA integrity scanning protein DisA with diadenylate cyclase activity